MDFFDPLSRVSPMVLLLLVLMLTAALCTTAVGCCRALTFLRRLRREQRQQIGTLRIQRMLHTLGIKEQRYLGKTDSLRVEVHLVRCRHCPDPQACDAFLNGKRDALPKDFCPNFHELLSVGRSSPTGNF